MTEIERYAPASDAEGWKEWAGGECPLAPETLVEYRVRCGLTITRGTPAGGLKWEHSGTGGDILAYRCK